MLSARMMLSTTKLDTKFTKWTNDTALVTAKFVGLDPNRVCLVILFAQNSGKVLSIQWTHISVRVKHNLIQTNYSYVDCESEKYLLILLFKEVYFLHTQSEKWDKPVFTCLSAIIFQIHKLKCIWCQESQMFFSLFDSGPFKVTPARPEVFRFVSQI